MRGKAMAKKQNRNDAAPKEDIRSNAPGKLTDAVHLSETLFQERVNQKAYELFQRRGGEPGHDMEDWLEAERLVRDELSREQSAERKSKTPRNKT
jgi:hypothetical protein